MHVVQAETGSGKESAWIRERRDVKKGAIEWFENCGGLV